SAEIRVRYDVVDHADQRRGIAAQPLKPADYAIGGLLAERHRLAVQAAERAVLARAPPAAAAALVRQPDLHGFPPGWHRVLELGEIVIKARLGQSIHIETGITIDDALIGQRRARDHPLQKAGE